MLMLREKYDDDELRSKSGLNRGNGVRCPGGTGRAVGRQMVGVISANPVVCDRLRSTEPLDLPSLLALVSKDIVARCFCCFGIGEDVLFAEYPDVASCDASCTLSRKDRSES